MCSSDLTGRLADCHYTLIVLMLRRPQGLFGSEELSRKMFKFGGKSNGRAAEGR